MNEQCGDNRFELIKKYKNKLIESTNIETSLEEMAALDDILFRMWQMGWLDSLEALDNYKKIKVLMNKYNIKSVDELEHIILNDATGEDAFRNYVETNVMPYRNIEMELGISLVTLFKALRSGIHIIDDGYPYNDRVNLIYSNSFPCGFKGKVGDHCVFFKDYGKTWSLTKEELL